MVLGAGGFIGTNLLLSLLKYRPDVVGVSQDPANNWRFLAAAVPLAQIRSCDISDFTQVCGLIEQENPATIFNLAAYGAYSKQREYKKIYSVNFNAAIDILELVRHRKIAAYVQAGSSAEYGLNSASPAESSELRPNSHYAVSKAALSLAVKYYREVEKLPVVHLRLYSVYGPWEEPDRLFPVLIAHARNQKLPPLVEAEVSREFVQVTVVTAECPPLLLTVWPVNVLVVDVPFELVSVTTAVKVPARR